VLESRANMKSNEQPNEENRTRNHEPRVIVSGNLLVTSGNSW